MSAPVANAVQVAVPYAPPPCGGGGRAVPMILGLLVLVVGGVAGLVWYVNKDSVADSSLDQVAAVKNEAGTESPPEPKAAAPLTPAPVEAPAAVAGALKPPAEAAPKPAAALPIQNTQPAPLKPQPPAQIVAIQPVVEKKPTPARGLSKEEQMKVDAAIDRGVRFLKANQLPTGTWRRDGFHAIGYAALPGLTLLECQVPATDPVIKRAAALVRRYAHNVNDTYDLSLALLFLDRLAERSDRPLIQQIALRLVAAQTGTGGWAYESSALTRPEMADLMGFLQQTRPSAAQLSLPAGSRPEQKSLQKSSSTGLNKSLPGDRKAKLVPKDSVAKPKPERTAVPPKSTASGAGKLPLRIDSLPPIIRRLAIVNPQGNTRGIDRGGWKWMQMFPMRDDNSNSQFAMLALWAARRHDVPTEHTLRLADKRYHTSQNRDGGWGYQIDTPTTSAMTGVGLLGLAVGHGSSDQGLLAAAHAMENKAPARNLLNDPAIHDGLEAFARHVGGAGDPVPFQPNLYFLWTVERVAMLYNLRTIGNKDWYRWGVHTLIPSQQPAGAWSLGGYPGADTPIDTSFALLFLKRSNLVQDLTRNLTFYLAITDPASAAKRK